jgi:hypothetical protein
MKLLQLSLSCQKLLRKHEKNSQEVAMLPWLKMIRFDLIDRLDLTNADERFRQRKARETSKTENKAPHPSNTSNNQGDTP